jgi:SM-20-related protein
MIEIDASKESLDWSKYDLDKDEIFVIDNLFPWWFVEHLDTTLLHGFGWQYGLCSSHKKNADGTSNFEYDKGADEEFEVPCFKQSIYPPRSESASDPSYGMIFKAVMSTLPFEVELGEILVNGQQYIHNTTAHQDCSCDNGISFIYYVNRNWKDSWGGATRVQTEDGWVEIFPKPGRVCLFKGNIPHHGMPPNDNYRGLRATLVYKTMRTIPLPPKKRTTML